MFLGIDAVEKSYGNLRVLNRVTFQVNEGELVSIIGPSGAGKTTLLKIIAGLEEADRGLVTSTADLQHNPAILVFQDYLLFPTMTVFANVAFGLRCRKTEGSEIRRRVLDMLDYFQIADKQKFYPNQLSAGQQQRVALARAMVVSPSILLLDEPFANLDRNLKAETAEFIRNFQREYTITTLSVTHDLQEAFMMSDKIGIMLDGRLCQYGDVRTVYNHPVSTRVADFLGHVNIIPARCLAAVGLEEEKPAGDIRVRAEAIGMEKDSNGHGFVTNILFAGHFIIYRVHLDDIVLTAYSFDPDFAEGDRVRIHIKHFIPMEDRPCDGSS